MRGERRTAEEILERYGSSFAKGLAAAVPRASGALGRLHEAMRYSLEAGGKRLRPALCFASCEALGVEAARAERPAVALELVHTYSLIHDDLPCMDDDDMRRGKPASHRVYGEALAILAGDALLTRAFEILAEEAAEGSAPAEAASRLEMVRTLAAAAGSLGMVGGQALDLAAEGSADVDLPTLQYIHTRKTGALFGAACRLGGLAGGGGPGEIARLGRFGEKVGLAFQIVDDVLDETGQPEDLGKAARKDRVRGKATYPQLLGLEESRGRVEELRRQAEELARSFGRRGEALELLAAFVARRCR